jgi:hypothetical protein
MTASKQKPAEPCEPHWCQQIVTLQKDANYYDMITYSRHILPGSKLPI